ncbi:MAG: hypothetical protein JST88_00665 [Bacteroidetes bacterium]|nr:hypothetical protein [Bacteroidota bacterium]
MIKIKEIDTGFIKDYGLTFLSFIFSSISNMAIFYILPIMISKQGSEIFAVYKKTGSLLLVALIGGMGVAVPKYVLEYNAKFAKAILVNGLVFSFLLSVTTFSLFLMLPDFFGNHLIGSVFKIIDVIAIFSIVFGGIINGIIFGYLRGLYNVKLANLSIVLISIAQLLSTMVFKNIYYYIYLSSALSLFLSLLILYRSGFSLKHSFLSFREHRKSMFTYGILRVPGDFSLDGLTTFPVIIVTNSLGIQVGGQMAFAMTIFGLVLSVLSPINFMILPKVSIIIKEGNDWNKVKKIVNQGVLFVLPMVTLLIVGIMFFANSIAIYIFHSSMPYLLANYIRFVSIAALFYSVFSLLRGVLDAAYKIPINSYICMFTMFVFVMSYFLTKSFHNGIFASMIFSYAVLSMLSIFFYKRLFKLRRN